MFRTPRRL